MYIGIIGLPFSGKTTVFQTLTGSDSHGMRAAGKVSSRIVPVPDARLQALAALYQSRKVTAATIEFADPGLPGQQESRVYVEQLLPLMRDADALAHVLRAFDDPAVPHPYGQLDPIRDLTRLSGELLFADLMVVEKRLERLSKDLKKVKNVEFETEYALLQRCREALEAEEPLRTLQLSGDEQKRLRGFGLLTSKPQLVVLNLDEAHGDAEKGWLAALAAHLPFVEAGCRDQRSAMPHRRRVHRGRRS